jgi:hypothetical protein
MPDPSRLPLIRLLIVGLVVPALFSSLDHGLLTSLQYWPSDTAHIALTMGAFVVQIGLMGWLCGRWMENPWWRWGLYGWSWILLDLQLFSIAGFAGANYWDNRGNLPSSLIAAQVGLAIVWAILGTTRWTIRLPFCVVAATLLSLVAPPRSGYGISRDLFTVQLVALAVLCLVLRWRKFKLEQVAVGSRPANSPASASGKPLQYAQFNIRHVLIWTTSLALVLGVLRAFDMLSPSGWLPLAGSSIVALLTAGLVVACVFVVAVWAALGSGPDWLRLLALVLWLPMAGLVLALLDMHSANLRWSTSPGVVSLLTSSWAQQQFLDDHVWLGIWAILAGSLLFASLIILRVIGYRLARTRK